MNAEVVTRLENLPAIGLIALFVWAYYRDRKFPSWQKYSTFAQRFWAGAVDSLVLWPLGFLSAVIQSFQVSRQVALSLVAVECLVGLFYTAQMHALYGRTVGKMVTKVRVVDVRTEQGISVRQAWLRESIPVVLGLGVWCYQVFSVATADGAPGVTENGEAVAGHYPSRLMTALPTLWFFAEVATMLTNKKRRALHDFIAGTVVIGTNSELNTAQLALDEEVCADAVSGGPPC